MVPEFMHFQNFKAIVIVWLACSAVADTAITIALVWHLRRHRTGFSGTDDAVNRIIRLTVQTGLVTALCAIVDLVLFLASSSGFHLIFNLPLSKLYTNSLMSSLNSRAGWKYGSNVGGPGNVNVGIDLEIGGTSSERRRRSTTQKTSHVTPQKPQQVYIDIESHDMRDCDLDTKESRSPDTLRLSVPNATTMQDTSSDSDASTYQLQVGADTVGAARAPPMYRAQTVI
ncbi:hypothetical protein EUX98_g5918 [Antrodiella citrinella]|uniref:DUF6534 domain-containing protein n=1 Tax=Antrodiella citrinella TaxID=2447956 RepID=A0A4S4MXZ4_9APHY|nr:hypothetical protein EUX98_g5918 [Antrodiella citrinella]